jgi:hypothetical protein
VGAGGAGADDPAAAVGAGGGVRCSEGSGAGAATVGAGGVDDGVGVADDGTMASADTFVPRDADRLLKREPSRLATRSTPTDKTTIARATQLVFILTAWSTPTKSQTTT